MNPGTLRHRVTIQNRIATQDDTTGNITETWGMFATVWADVHPLSVKEFVAAGISDSKVTAYIKIRYLAGIKPSMRVLQGEHVYNVEGVLPDPKSGNEFITLPVSEVVNG